MEDLLHLSALIKKRNATEAQITSIIGRPAMVGHLGEYIASKVFDIALMESANAKGSDGVFSTGRLAGQFVNIKWYTRDQRLLDINPNGLPDYYLVLTGHTDKSSGSSKGKAAPWLIHNVYMFNARHLMDNLNSRGVKIGVATSIAKQIWEAGEIYPAAKNSEYEVAEWQKELLGYFRD